MQKIIILMAMFIFRERKIMKEVLYTAKKETYLSGRRIASGEIVRLQSMHLVVNGTSTVTVADKQGYLHSMTDKQFRRAFAFDMVTGD